MKVHGFLKDVTGASRVTKARHKLIDNASSENLYKDPLRQIAEELHPEELDLVITKVKDASPTARTIRLERKDGKKLPPFQAGQYISLHLTVDQTITTRPYSISSAPFEARKEDHPFVEITVRRSAGNGFIADWLYDNAKEGMDIKAALPFGQFYYEPLRDSKHVLALAGGSGITPFASMAKEIANGTLDLDLTILYGSVSTKDIILKEELEALKCDKVRLVYVISGDEPYDGEKGFINAELIKKYAEGKDTTYFVCGPLAMYRFVSGELKKLGIPARRIRMEVFAPAKVNEDPDYPKGKYNETFKLTVVRGQQKDVIEAKADESILVAIERAGIPTRSRCRSGACGMCRCKVLEGNYFLSDHGESVRFADKENNYVHACTAYPLTDLTVRIPIL